MKIFFILFILTLVCISFFFFQKKNEATVTARNHGPFTIKMEVTSNRRLNNNFRWITETNIAYSVWYHHELIKYPSPTQENTGYTHLWRVYILEGAPQPTLIAGSQSLFMITEEKGKALVTPLDTQNSDFANLQFLDGASGTPDTVMNVYMATKPDSIKILKGGEYLLVNQRLVVHIPDLKRYSFNDISEKIDGYHFINVGGAQSFSPDKQSLAFMGGKYDDNNKYGYAMITYNLLTQKTGVVPYNRTKTRSVDLNYENREWFKTYFEWIKDEQHNYQLQLRKFDVLPAWEGAYADNGVVYQLTPVKNEMQQVFADFILKELNLKKEDIHPGPQYSSNMMVIYYNNYRFNLWLRPEDKIVVLMMQDNYVPEAAAGIKIIHRLGDSFNKQLKSGKYQEYFSQLKD